MFVVHRSERADRLVAELGRILSVPPVGPGAGALVPEQVAVPTRGVERWVTQQLAGVLGASPGRADGVCANVAFPFPGRLVGDVLAVATDVPRDRDPWRPERLTWAVLDAIDAELDQPWLSLVAAHLGGPGPDDALDDADRLRRRRRFATARHVAELFDRYEAHRPEMVRGWMAGDDERSLGAGGLPEDAGWQPELLRTVAARLGVAPLSVRLLEATERLVEDPELVDLPPRLAVFGVTRLPAAQVEVLRALAVHRDVHVLALHPSAPWWDAVAATVGAGAVPRPRRDAWEATGRLAANPLLRTWADDSRELQLVLAGAGEPGAGVAVPTEHRHHGAPDDAPPTTLLARIQADVRADRAPDALPPLPLRARDRSLALHECHGRARQVEVLHEAICHLLAEDPTLEPRDVIVLCPDIEAFAPLLHATFGAPVDDATDGTPSGGGPRPTRPADAPPPLPYRLADRALRRANPLLGALADLLELADARIGATELLDLAASAPVRRRFGFDDDDLERIGTWVADAGVRWGLDDEHRDRWSMRGVATGTWAAGLDRLLVGVASEDDPTLADPLVVGVLPLDDVDSRSVSLAGRLAELVARVRTLVEGTRRSRPVADWVALLGDALDGLTRAPFGEEWQRAQADRILRDVLAEATGADGARSTRPLHVAEVRALLDHRLRGVPTTADFRTGAITMCTLVPMRAVPHRVVCVLGLDAAAFPRVSGEDGDDLLALRPRIGDRDPRTEDRQLLLDAVLAAGDHLVLTTSTRDPRTNEARPLAVPVEELLDVADACATTADGRPVREAVARRHPIQPFSPAAHDAEDPWGFVPARLDAARALLAARPAPPAGPSWAGFLPGPLPHRPEPVVDLDELVRFLQHPARELCRQRLEMETWDDDSSLDDEVPYVLDGLGAWGVGDRMLAGRRAGRGPGEVLEAERRRGLLPPGELGERELRRVTAAVDDVLDRVERLGLGGVPGARDVDVVVPTPDGERRVVGTVPGIHDDEAPRLGRVSFSRIKPKDRLGAWTRLLALTLADRGDQPWESLLVGTRNRSGRKVADLCRHRRIADDAGARRDQAAELLGRLVALRDRGLRQPLPLPCDTGEAWARALRWGDDPVERAAERWHGSWSDGGDAGDVHNRRVLGEGVAIERLLAEAPTPEEQGPGWDLEQRHRLGRLAVHVWGPVLEREANR